VIRRVLIILFAASLLLALSAPPALAQVITDPLPLPEPDPVPEPEPEPAPAPSPSPSPSPSRSATTSPPAETKKPAKKKRRAQKEKPAPIRIQHEPRDVPVWSAATGPPSFEAQSFTSGESASSSLSVRLFAVGGLALALLLLGVAAIPEWVMRPARAALLLAEWRVQIAASGVSALFAALIVFLIGTSRI
jgi:hypothetical protein